MGRNNEVLDLIASSVKNHKLAMDSLENNVAQIIEVTDVIADCLKSGGTVFACGNGGSASDAQHFAAELVGRFVFERKGLAAVALTTDTSIITAVANDYSYDDIFSRQIDALGSEKDVLLAISTSGNSQNVVRAINASKVKNCSSILLSGKDGGEARPLADYSIVIGTKNTAAIQEMHIVILHMICRILDSYYQNRFFN